MRLPLVKLGTLTLRTLCKPIANRLKQQAGLHPKFRNSIISIAQANHRFSTTVQRRFYGTGLDVEIQPLNEQKAINLASNLLGELFVFTVAGAALIFEVQRNSRAEAKKEELRKQELQMMKQKHDALQWELDQLRRKADDLERIAKSRRFLGLSLFGNVCIPEEARPKST